MKPLKDQFVPYELALLAKEKRFDEPCITKWENRFFKPGYRLYPVLATLSLDGPYEKESNGYDQKQINEGGYHFTGYKNSVLDHGNQVVAAPLWQQLVDWFKIEHDIKIVESRQYGWEILQKHDNEWFVKYDITDIESAIHEAFKLI